MSWFANIVDEDANDLSHVEVLKEPFFAKKFLRLIGILSTFRLVFKLEWCFSIC